MLMLPQAAVRCLSRLSLLFPKAPDLSSLLAVGFVLLLLASQTHSAEITLTLEDPNNDPTEVGGYNLYYRQHGQDAWDRVNIGQQTSYTLTGLEAGQTYYVALTAHDGDGGRESDFSNIVDTDGTIVAVNAGGPAYTSTTGTLYGADKWFSGGRTYSKATAITATENDVLYQSERFGDFTYAIPVANGDYTVTLQFAEIYWSAAGKRIFDVEIEGAEVQSNLDLVAAAGQYAAYDVAIPVSVTDNVLDISFHTNANNAKVSAIKVTAEMGTQPPVNHAPVADHDTATTTEETAVAIPVLANDTDADGDALTVASVSQATNGAVVSNGTNVTYTPNVDFHGTDTFTYTASDGNGDTATGTVTVKVTMVNDIPVTRNTNLTTLEDTTASSTLSASDVDGDALTYRIVTHSTKGTVTLTNVTTGAYTYTPYPNISGTDTFGFRANDGTADSSVATVRVTIVPVNDMPVAANDAATTEEDKAITIPVLANDTDIDGDALSVVSTTQGANGTVTATGDTVRYTPKANFYGPDTFIYMVSDKNGGTSTGTVSITVTAVNDAPVAHNGTLTATKDMVASGTLSADDEDGDALTYRIVANGDKGTVALTDAATGAYTYLPHPDASGTDTFTFRASDGKTDSDVATVTIAITLAEPDKVVFAVNAGGPEYVNAAGTLYEADTLFSGGRTFTRARAIANTEDDVLYQSERFGNFSYTVNLPNGDYIVTLQFAEIYWTQAGRRTFDVTIEGAEVVRELDLVAEVGQYTAHDMTIPVRVTDEALTISFRTGRNNAKVSAIVVEVDEEVPLDDPASVIFAVNAGGPEYVDATGTLYEADTLFSGGRTYARATAIAGTEDDVLYQSERFGNFAYNIPLPNDTYMVTLQFAEIYWGQAGQRRFDVKIEGTKVVSNLDLVAEVGPTGAYEVTFPVHLTDEELNLTFRTDRDNAKVSAIRIKAGGETF